MLRNSKLRISILPELRQALAILFLACLTDTAIAANIPGKLLRNNSWELIVFPNAALAASFADILGDDLDLLEYKRSWVLYSYDSQGNLYQSPSLSAAPTTGRAYWILQSSGADVTIDVPVEIQKTSPYSWGGNCQAGVSPCLSIALASNPGESSWHLIGSPHVGSLALRDTRILSDNVNQTCFSGCQLDTALKENIARNILYTFDGASNEYQSKTTEDVLDTWEGFWLLTLSDAVTPALHLPEKPFAYFDDDNLASVLLLPEDTNSLEDLNSSQLMHVSNGIYDNFEDSFDFLFLLLNNDQKPPSLAFGKHLSIKNEILGLGKSVFDNTAAYGSAGRLRGINYFPYRSGMVNGPGLHEMMHSWGNFLFDTTRSSHWGFAGFSGGRGQLGGFDSNTLTSLGNNRYSVQSFGEIANGGNSIAYNLAELYLMGLIDSSSVGDITIATNPQIVAQENGNIIFTADSVSTLGFDVFLIQSGVPPRVPLLSTVNDYTSLTVLMTTQVPTEAQVNEISEQARFFTSIGDNGNRLFNFNEATGFRATLSAERPVDHTAR